MKNFIKHILVLLFGLCSHFATAQDIHFSQFFANPISYNPANTGFFNGNYRLGANHKQQWPWAVKGKFTNYISASGYADFSIAGKKMGKLDWLGVGLNFINDQAGDGTLQLNKMHASLAYHKGLDRYHKHFISLGFTAAYVNRAINFKALYFNNQWKDRVGFVTEIPNFENLATESFSYLDIGFGLQGRNVLSAKSKLTYGFTMLHINRPKETFYGQSNKLGIRYLVHAVYDYKLSDKVDLMASAYFTLQKQAIESLFGARFSYNMRKSGRAKDSKLIAGAFYRINDALAPMLGYQYHKTRIIMNFDVTLSQLIKASRGNGGIEVSIVHVGLWNTKLPSERKTNCYDF